MGRDLVRLAGGGLCLAVDPCGAQMRSFRAADGPELLWQGDPRYWTGHAPLLFPLISQLPTGSLRHGGRAYPMPPHGFAQHKDFALLERTGSACVLELRDDAETRTHYPFAFVLRAGFGLAGGGLCVTVSVENPNDEPLPADVGFHPGFNWPLEPGRAREEYAVVFEAEEPRPVRTVTGDPAMLLPGTRPTPVEGNVLRPRDAVFEEGPVVFEQPNSRSVVFGTPGGPGLRVDFPDSPNLAVWTKPGAPFLCIEPWQGLPAEVDFDGPFVEKPGVALVPPGATGRWRLGVTVLPDGGVPDDRRRSP